MCSLWKGYPNLKSGRGWINPQAFSKYALCSLNISLNLEFGFCCHKGCILVIVLSNKSPKTKLSPDVKAVPPKGGFVRMKTSSPFINIAVTSPLFHSQPEITVLEKLIASGSAPASN